MRATGVPEGKKSKKHYLIRFLGARAGDLIPTLATRYRDTQRDATGSSSSCARQQPALPDPFYFSVIRNIVSEVHANPSKYACTLNDEELVAFAKTTLVRIHPPLQDVGF